MGDNLARNKIDWYYIEVTNFDDRGSMQTDSGSDQMAQRHRIGIQLQSYCFDTDIKRLHLIHVTNIHSINSFL
jgi:hypothetical protein